MKNLLILFLFTISFSFTFSQADSVTWEKGGQGGITFNQIALSNWAAGGQGNLTLIGNMNVFANRKSPTTSWDNSLDLGYGFLKNYFPQKWDLPVTKAEDKIEFMSKYGKKAWGDKSFYSAFFNFRTQFAPGYQKQGDTRYISKFMSPAYLQFGIGMDFKLTDYFSVTVAPISGKVTIVADDSLAGTGAFGVNTYMEDDPTQLTPGNGKNARFEFGATVLAKFKKDIMKNVGYESNLNLFSNYIYQPQFIDVKWTNAFVAKVNKFIVVNLFIDLIYDHDILIGLVDPTGQPKLDIAGVQVKGRKLQLKEVFGVGFSYKF